jgi:uncharacterized protein
VIRIPDDSFLGRYDDSVYLPGVAEAAHRTPLYSIPYQSRFIVYAPLRRLAFVGNEACVELAARSLREPELVPPPGGAEARGYLESIGLLDVPLVDPATLEVEPCFAPSIAVLLLTTTCNFRCEYCYASAGGERGELMPLSAGKAAIDIVCANAQRRGESRFALSFHGGGEPILAWEHLHGLVEYARSRPLAAKISLASNGYWSPKQTDWILSNVDDVSLSCDGLPEVQDRQRPLASGAPTAERVFATIRQMDRRGVSYGIRMTVTETDIESLPRGIEFLCRETSCRSFQAEAAFNHGRARSEKHAVVSGDRFVSAFLEAFDIARECDRELTYSGARPWALTGNFCTAPLNALIVGRQGRLTACYEVFDPALELGDQFFFGRIEPDGTLNVDQDRRGRLLGHVRERRALCRGCFCFWHCAGDCPAKTLTADGTGHLRFGPRCEINRAITKELLVRLIFDAGGLWQGGSPDGGHGSRTPRVGPRLRPNL